MATTSTQTRAPKGGCTIKGVFYRGGRMLPAGAVIVDRHAAAQKAWQTRRSSSTFDASASARKAWATRRNPVA